MGCLAVPAGSAGAAQMSGQPNIIVFLVDDMGWMDSSCYGSRFYQTPNMDALAGSGILFTDAYSACTVSSPTRAALMTGKYPARLHLTDFIAGHDFAWAKMSPPEWTKYLPVEEVTVAEVLKDAGYSTWHVGKWHLGQDEEYYPQNQGFDVNIGGCGMGSPSSPGPVYKGYFSPYAVRYNLEPGPEGEYLTDRLTDEAVRLIMDSKGDPFYLNMAHYAVHMPIQGKPELVKKYGSLVDSSYFQTNAAYAAMVESMDESLGRIMQALEDKGIADNTLIIFTSDNGSHQKVSASCPLRSGKGSEYEGGIRVPMIISWPGHVKPGTVSSEPVITMDIASTIMDIAGSGQISGTDGKSLVPVLEGRRMPVRPLFWHYPHYHTAKPYSAVRYGRWKLIEHLEDGTLSLYDLKKDMGETTDLSARKPAKTEELYSLLDAWRKEVNARFPVPNPEYDPEKEGRIRKKPSSGAGNTGRIHITPASELVKETAEEIYEIDTCSVYSEVYRHNPDLKLYFLYPEGIKAEEKRPAIVFFFGGGWTGGSVQSFAMQGRELADRGMIAILADYRTRNRYGTDPSACVQDAKSAMRYVKKNADRLQIDTMRLAAGGGSAGGHLAAATATVEGFDSPEDDLSVSPVPNALVLFNPVFNNAPEPEGYGYSRIKQYFPQFSPYHNITPGAPPALILLGTEDHLIPVPVAESFVRKMHDVGSYCEMELYEGAGHGFFNYNKKNGSRYYRPVLDRVILWLESLGYID